jgi:hypothetical protein
MKNSLNSQKKMERNNICVAKSVDNNGKSTLGMARFGLSFVFHSHESNSQKKKGKKKSFRFSTQLLLAFFSHSHIFSVGCVLFLIVYPFL